MTDEKGNVVHDRTGRRIYPGDLLRSRHYGHGRGTRYIYHVAVMRDGLLTGVPTCHLEKTLASPKDGVFPLWLIEGWGFSTRPEIICGHGPGEILDYGDRPRESKPEALPEKE